MNSSILHDHFRRATSMSPIQFVMRMRLHEARGLLLEGEAAFDVGYTSPSRFSREFRRMFGESPIQITA